MSRHEYLNFDLTFKRNNDGYVVQVIDSPGGQASAPFEIPFNQLELENLMLRLGQRRAPTRRVDSPEMEALKRFGGRLYDVLFSADVRACLRSSLDEAQRQEKGLRIRLRFANAPELADLPWEFLYSSSVNRFLALSRQTPVVRYIDLPRQVSSLKIEPPLRILAMISDPSDHERLDVEKEWQRLQSALADLVEQGLVEIERLDQATLLTLRRMLRRSRYHIFHFIGHGVFDEHTDQGYLVMEDEQGRGQLVSGQDLGMILFDHSSLRLAVLNICEGGRASRQDPFAGAAQSLVQQGLPAVIAMQFEITDRSATLFAHEFYLALADGYPVDAALAEARLAIFATSMGSEWGVPVLFMRSPDGHLFDVSPIPPEKRPPREVPPEKVEEILTHPATAASGSDRRITDLPEPVLPPVKQDSEPEAPPKSQPLPPIDVTKSEPASRPAAKLPVKYQIVLAGLGIFLIIGFLLLFQNQWTGQLVSGATPTPTESIAVAGASAPDDLPPLPTQTATSTPTPAPAATAIPTPTPRPTLLLLPTRAVSVVTPAVMRPAQNGLFHASFVNQADILIDGDGKDWQALLDSGAVAYNFNKIVYDNGCSVIGTPGRTDLEAKVMFAYNDRDLYVAFWVLDDLYVDFTENSLHYFRGDSPQLMLDLDLAGDFNDTRHSDDDILIDLLPRAAGQYAARPGTIVEGKAKISTLVPERASAYNTAQVRTAFTDYGYFIEARLPWRGMGLPAIPADRVLGIAPSVSDNDTPGTNVQECMISAAPNRQWGNPTSWGTLVLLPPGAESR